MATKPVKNEATPRSLQLAALIAFGASFGLQWALTLSTAIQQLQYNSNLSSYTGFFIGTVVVPILFFAGAYFMNPRKLTKVGKLFESLIIMLVGQCVLQMVVQGVVSVQATFPWAQTPDAYMSFVLYEIGATAVTAVLYFALLAYLRTTKRWK